MTVGLPQVYLVIGLFLAGLAVQGLRDATNPKRATTGTFWGLLAVVFLVGDRLPAWVVGLMVLVLAGLAGAGGLGRGISSGPDEAVRRDSAKRLGHRLFIPVLLIPALTLLGLLVSKHLRFRGAPLVEPRDATLVCLALACAGALACARLITKAPLAGALQESRSLLDSIGWAAVLPLMLAMLGGVFAATGVGELIAHLVRAAFPMDLRFVAVVAYALGMAGFTVIMGNAFAAFPVMTAGIGLPILVQAHGADPASMAALGMLSGYCGTLLTPMAANFNIVPVALLELQDPHAVIKAQAPTGLVLLAVNILLMNLLIFPR